MSHTVGTPDVIDEVANDVVSEPLGHMSAAHTYLERDCALHPLAFGVLFAPLLTGDYEAARRLHAKNLAGGQEALLGMGQGLAAVAGNLRKADAASNLTSRALDDSEAYRPVKSTDGNLDTVFEGTALLMDVQLAAMALAVGELTQVAAELAWTAIIAAVGWGLVVPDDAALSKAHGGWEKAAEHLGKIDLEKVIGPLHDPTAWGGPSREAFDVWLRTLEESLHGAHEAAEANAVVLESLFHILNEFQTEAFLKSVEALVEILVCTALEEVPFVGPIFAAIALALGALLGYAIYEIIMKMYESIEATNSRMLQTVGMSSFAGLKVDSEGNTPSLTDVRIDWDDEDVTELAGRRESHSR